MSKKEKKSPDTSYKLPEIGYLRLKQIIGDPKANPPIPPILPISRSTFYARVKSCRFPQPSKLLGPRISAWHIDEILELISRDSKDTD